jgi:3-hydroxyisobutyrate dehydrogenase-like beta-hydroxyacid dehydrogenase
MTEISLIGSGAMGSALGRALLAGGHTLTVWNRTIEKTRALVAQGAEAAVTFPIALQASPVILVCVADYAATRNLLNGPNVAAALAGRTLIQLSTGTPREAREMAAWTKDHGIDYLDGAIMAYVHMIGGPKAQILVAGEKAVFARCRPYLASFASDVRHVGEDAGAAETLDLAILSEYLGRIVGTLHSLRLCEAEHVAADMFASLYPDGHTVRELEHLIHAPAPTNRDAPIRVWHPIVQRMISQARDAAINRDMPNFLGGLFERAIAAGLGEEDIAALIKVLRTDA